MACCYAGVPETSGWGRRPRDRLSPPGSEGKGMVKHNNPHTRGAAGGWERGGKTGLAAVGEARRERFVASPRPSRASAGPARRRVDGLLRIWLALATAWGEVGIWSFRICRSAHRPRFLCPFSPSRRPASPRVRSLAAAWRAGGARQRRSSPLSFWPGWDCPPPPRSAPVAAPDRVSGSSGPGENMCPKEGGR